MSTATAERTVLVRKRPPRRRRSKGHLNSVLRRLQIPVFTDNSVEEYMKSKVAASHVVYSDFERKLRSFESWLGKVEKTSSWIRNAIFRVAGLSIVLFPVAGLLGLTSLVYAPISVFASATFTAALFILIGSIFAVVLAMGTHRLFASEDFILSLKREYNEEALQNCTVRWETMSLECYKWKYGIPERAKALANAVLKELPGCQLVVEYTAPDKSVALQEKVWDGVTDVWTPDPFLTVRFGKHIARIYAWDEEGLELPSLDG